MELHSENGRKIFIQRGCRKELGRAPGLALKDRTVSRRQIVLELAGDDISNKVNAYVEVVGPNPICILRHGNAIQGVGSKYHRHDIEFLETGAKFLLQVGDKLSLSITEPNFLTLKVSGDRKEEQKDDACLKEVASVDELAAQAEPGGASNHDCAKLVKKAEKGDDLLEAWKSRRLAKKLGAPDCKVEGILQQKEEDGPVERSAPAFQKDDNLGRLNQMRNNEMLELQEVEQISSKEEEEGIAEAVARRKRLRFELQKEQRKQLEKLELDQNTVDVSKASTSKDVAKIQDEMESEQVDYSQQKHINLLQVDPVADFGFIVEGSEFDKFKGCKNGRNLDWYIDRKRPADNDNEEEEDSSSSRVKGARKNQPKFGKRSLQGHREVEDEDWEGESEDEKVLVTKVKKPRREVEIRTRSRYHSGSETDEQGKTAHNLADIRQKDDQEDDLTGFIVEDSEEEADDDKDEDEWTDDSSDEELNEECEDSEHANTKEEKGSKKSCKPLCEYGSKCYRD
ncbi:hypothetical protein O6H91_11G107400 [Diphasiastrum complanatum]|uniref:Uncharacterized protein n=1 Tax=Diphasiastrum complanatum TaxID=34168 RepID=A0ACC2CCV2_DIPCM|nr:hypothetical protein O6H91_11G107400 [Diphasiastrum complanatum]